MSILSKVAGGLGMGLFDKPKIKKPVDIFARGKKIKKGPQKGQYEPSIASKQLAGVTGYYGEALPSFLNLSGQYTPQFMQQAFGFGGQALTGFQALQDTAAAQAARSMADLRAQELGTMTGQAGLARGLMQSLSPEQARSIELQRQATERAQGLEGEFQATSAPLSGMFGTMAQEAFARRGTLSPEEQRATQQRARESAISAGRLGGNAAIAAEIQNREAAQAARRQEASGMAGLSSTNLFQTEAQRAALRGEAQRAGAGLYEMGQQFYQQPGLELLRGTPASYTAGSQLAGIGMGYGQSLGPQLDYNMPLNFAQQSAGALDAFNMAKFQADQQRQAQMIGLIKNIGAVAAAPATGGGSLAMMG